MKKFFKRTLAVLIASVVVFGSVFVADYEFPELMVKAATDIIAVTSSPEKIYYSFDAESNAYINGECVSSFPLKLNFETESEEEIHFSFTVTVPDGFSTEEDYIYWGQSVSSNTTSGRTIEIFVSNPLAIRESEIVINVHSNSELVGYATIPVVNRSANKTVTGYFMNTDGTYPNYMTTMPADENGNVAGFTRDEDSYYARNIYTLTFDCEGLEQSIVVYYGASIFDCFPMPPMKEGYNFLGWADEDGSFDIPETMPARNLTLTAVFRAMVYYTAYFYVDGYPVSSLEASYGAIITMPAAPHKDGYEFVGWCDEEGNIYNDCFRMPAENMYFYAVFVESTQPTTYYGKLESYEWNIVINNPSESYVSEITVDGKTYDVKSDLIDYDIEEYVDKDIVFSVKEDKVIWFDVVKNLKTSVSVETNIGTTLNYSGSKYDKEELNLHVYVYNNLKEEKANAEGLKGLEQLNVYVSNVKIKLDNDDLLSFDGKKEITVPINKYIPIGSSYSVALSMDVNSKHKIADTVEFEHITISGEMTGTQNGEEIKKYSSRSVTVNNKNYSKPTNKNNQANSSSNASKINAQAQKAAQELSKVSGAFSVGPMGTNLTLAEIFTTQQLNAIGDMLLCAVSLANAPEEKFSEVLSKKVIEKVFQCDTSLFGVSDDSVSVTVSSKTKYGEIKVKFICDFQRYILSGSSFSFFGDISYEIVGGKGRKNLPASCQSEGMAGMITGYDLTAFCNAAYSLVLSELKESYSVGWGSEANKAADIIFNKSIIKILSYTKYNSVSGLTWELLTTPAKSVKIKCPVDVYVYNSNNELVASIGNNVPTLENDLVEIIVNGDEKEVILFDDSYYLVYEARAEGTMNITVTEYGNSEGALKTSSLENVPLSVGTIYNQTIDTAFLEDSDYSLISAEEGACFTATDELLLHNHVSDGEWFDGEKATCTQYGYNYTSCTVCDEWFCEYFEPTGHVDENNNDYCELCSKYLKKGNISISIGSPSNKTINYGETIKLYANTTNLPASAKIKWIVEGNGVKIKPSSSGKACDVTSVSTGEVIIKAYVVDKNGNTIRDDNGKAISDSEYLYSDANLWLRIVYFFRKIFG